MAKQKLLIITVNGIVDPVAYTGMFGLCKDHGLSYSMATKGKTIFQRGEDIIRISEVEVKKITGRENNSKSNKQL